jgi:hypothetical protein
VGTNIDVSQDREISNYLSSALPSCSYLRISFTSGKFIPNSKAKNSAKGDPICFYGFRAEDTLRSTLSKPQAQPTTQHSACPITSIIASISQPDS